MTPVVHRPNSKIEFGKWNLQGVYGSEVGTTLMLFSNKTWVYLSGYVSSRNNGYWAT